MRPSWDHRDPATGLTCLHLPTQDDSSDSEDESEWKDEDDKTHLTEPTTYSDSSDIEEDNEAILGDDLTPKKIPAAASPTMYQIEQVVRGFHHSDSLFFIHSLTHFTSLYCIYNRISRRPQSLHPSQENLCLSLPNRK
jgi:hypothetical protein